jgi:hypothetical protein
MSSPLETAEFQNLYVGDTRDDDGQVIDSFLVETDKPATPVTEKISPAPLVSPKRWGRLFTGSYLLQFGANALLSPYQILPADIARKSVTFSILSLAAAPTAYAEYVSISDENGKVISLSGGYNLRHGKDPLVLTDYTGPVYVFQGPAITANIEISWVAVTE